MLNGIESGFVLKNSPITVDFLSDKRNKGLFKLDYYLCYA